MLLFVKDIVFTLAMEHELICKNDWKLWFRIVSGVHIWSSSPKLLVQHSRFHGDNWKLHSCSSRKCNIHSLCCLDRRIHCRRSRWFRHREPCHEELECELYFHVIRIHRSADSHDWYRHLDLAIESNSVFLCCTSQRNRFLLEPV